MAWAGLELSAADALRHPAFQLRFMIVKSGSVSHRGIRFGSVTGVIETSPVHPTRQVSCRLRRTPGLRMSNDDQAYHREREQHCRAMAKMASDPDVRRRHEELALLHADRAARDDDSLAATSGELSAI